MSLEIYLIRHAETEANCSFRDKIMGRSNWVKLTLNGIAQSEALGERLRAEKVAFTAFYSSPAIRTQQTARYSLSGGLYVPVQLEPALLELSQGDWEGKDRNEIYNRPDVREGLDKDGWNHIPGDVIKGESQAMVAQRMANWTEDMVRKHEEGRIMAFTHGLAIKSLLTLLFDGDKRTSYKTSIDNTSITIINYENGAYSCVKKNDTAHLDKAELPKVRGVLEVG
ncbi:MAG: histidine phosphatase family protein [Nanoarchaeota archaeon]